MRIKCGKINVYVSIGNKNLVEFQPKDVSFHISLLNNVILQRLKSKVRVLIKCKNLFKPQMAVFHLFI